MVVHGGGVTSASRPTPPPFMNEGTRDEADLLFRRRSMDGPLHLERLQGTRVAMVTSAHRLMHEGIRRERSRSDCLDHARAQAAIRLQRFVRGYLGRGRAARAKRARADETELYVMVIIIQAAYRGRTARIRIRTEREKRTAELLRESSVLRLQRVVRGMMGRRQATERRRRVAALNIKRCYQAHLGRRKSAWQRAVLEELRLRNRAGLCVQMWWKCNRAVKEYARARAYSLAAVEIQRVYRGAIGRKRAVWGLACERAEGGPVGAKPGIGLIEDAHVIFEKQQSEIAALHNAEERAAIRTSKIRSELDCIQKKLNALERETNEIDHIENELSKLTQERSLLQLRLLEPGQATLQHDDALPSKALRAGYIKSGVHGAGVRGIEAKKIGFALKIKILTKRAEREKVKQEMEAGFRGVRAEVDSKRRELDAIIANTQEIENTRERGTVKFHRLQANLIEFLREQKTKIDPVPDPVPAVKEKGMALEVATVTSAAAAVATIHRAKDHKERCSAMFSRTEEHMRFQFMSTSISYFNSLYMLRTTRGIVADTATVTATSSADTAAEAAFLSPSTDTGKTTEASKARQKEFEAALKRKNYQEKVYALGALGDRADLEEAKAYPFPDEVRLWTTENVGHFLTTLNLGQYRRVFAEASVDGELLLALEPDDYADVLGVLHPLHSKELVRSIDKLRASARGEPTGKVSIEREQGADAAEDDRGGVHLEAESIFSQVRNGRLGRLLSSLDNGLPVDAEDEHGNTALIVACQNCDMEMCEALLRRGADVNHRNSRGNTALHYAMAYDPGGAIGEMLTTTGGDDTVINKDGLTCYEGL